MNTENKYILSFFCLSYLMSKDFCISCDLKLSFIRISQTKITYPVGTSTLHQHKFWGCSLVILAWLGHGKGRSGRLSFWYTFQQSLVVVCQVITWLHQVTCMNGSVSFWHVFSPRLVIVTLVISALWCF